MFSAILQGIIVYYTRILHCNIKMEPKTPLIRTTITVFPHQLARIRELEINLSEWVREQIDSFLSDDLRMERMIDDLRFKLEVLKGVKKQAKQKTETKKQIPEKEIVFLIETKKVIDANPLLIDGRINLYLNKFLKTYKLNRKEFMDLLFEAENQYREKQDLKDIESPLPPQTPPTPAEVIV